MAIAAVTQAFSQYAQKTTGTSGGSSSGSSSAAAQAAAQQEANETLATTTQEAAKGDRQAKLKLSKIQQNHPQTNTAPPEPGKGVAVDAKA